MNQFIAKSQQTIYSMKRRKKFYSNKGLNLPEKILYPDGSAVIHTKDGFIIIESQAAYGMSNLFYKFDDFDIALN